jgi:hypothetical protein
MNTAIDTRKYKWREVTPSGESYLVHHWYTILGHNQDAGTLDMLVRWGTDGGHCNLHRHMATTTVFILQGEQHLYDIDGLDSQGKGKKADRPRIRRVGDYGLSVGIEKPHFECGGPEGGIALFSTHSNDGVLYEILDENLNLLIPVTIELLVADFEAVAV